MKRFLDIVISIFALFVFGPVVLIMAAMIWRQDRHWPFYSPWRVGRKGKEFRMFKLRSMIVGADKNGVDTTIANDTRITPLGHRIRRLKIDELPQFANVLLGHMSLVGPRPNIDREVNLYSGEERHMLSVRPGITDLSSIVFSDLGTVLAEAEDPNIAYNQLVRPWKSRLSLFYVAHRNLTMDVRIIWLTIVAIFDNSRARRGVAQILLAHGASAALVGVVEGTLELAPTPPPGLDKVVTARNV